MHDLDCALVFGSAVVGVELKLGTTRMTHSDFRSRYLIGTNTPRVDQGRVAGSMVALLDWNGRDVVAPQTALSLRGQGKPVAQGWLLMLVDEVLKKWERIPMLTAALGTTQLVGILSLEQIAREVGPGEGKRLAKEIACEAIDQWTL